MRYARGSSGCLAILLVLLLAPAKAKALEIPVLTWENGKSQSVVLGGETAGLSWDLYLQGKGVEPLTFSRSRASDADFYVFTVALSRDLSPGAYNIVSQDTRGESTVLAGVQVVDRFSYDILEVPIDLHFVLLLFIAFLAIQISLRTWTRRDSNDSRDSTPYSSQDTPWVIGREALLKQRRRWQRRWFGEDDFLPGEVPPNRNFLAVTHVLSVVLSLFSALRNYFFPLDGMISVLLFATLATNAFWDRLSGRLSFLTYLTVFIVFNSTLNAPTLLALTLLLSTFLLPRYVGDVLYSLLARLGLGDWRTRYFASFGSAMAVGLSVFWLYLLSESTIQSDDTRASKVTLIAILTAVSQIWRALSIDIDEVRHDSQQCSGKVRVIPIVSLSSLAIVSIVACGVTISWTGGAKSSLISTLVFFGTLLTIYLKPSVSSRTASKIMSSVSPIFLVAVVLSLSAAVMFWISHIPEVVSDRSNWVLLLAGVPLAFFAFLRMVSVEEEKYELT